jgi:AraC-like DNA-binding protein
VPLTKVTKFLQLASSMVDADQAQAQTLLERARTWRAPGPAVLHKAWMALVVSQLAWSRNEIGPDQIAALEEAALTFAANDHHEEMVLSLALSARIGFALGKVVCAILASSKAFMQVRASTTTRLLAAGVVLWYAPPSEDGRSDSLLAQIRNLAASSPPSIGKSVACMHLAFRDFKNILFRAGVPTDSEPYPPSATLTLDEAKQAVAQLCASMQAHVPNLQSILPGEPIPILLLASMHGFAYGSTACLRWTIEVANRCGDSAEPYIHSVIGVLHLRQSNHVAAEKHLRYALDGYRRRARVGEGWPWYFYLSLALRAQGKYRDALEATDQFMSHRHHVYQHYRSAAAALQVPRAEPTDQSRAATAQYPVRQLSSKPPYVAAAIAWMEANLHQQIDIDDIVAASGVSRRTLEMGFRNFRNRTLAAELRQMRMQRARELLRSAAWSLSDVRLSVGYRSASAFSRDFRKAFGVAPSKLNTIAF